MGLSIERPIFILTTIFRMRTSTFASPRQFTPSIVPISWMNLMSLAIDSHGRNILFWIRHKGFGINPFFLYFCVFIAAVIRNWSAGNVAIFQPGVPHRLSRWIEYHSPTVQKRSSPTAEFHSRVSEVNHMKKICRLPHHWIIYLSAQPCRRQGKRRRARYVEREDWNGRTLDAEDTVNYQVSHSSSNHGESHSGPLIFEIYRALFSK